MEAGDLSSWHRKRILIVVEGVLCTRRKVISKQRRFREDIYDFETEWHEVPLKRLVVMRRNFGESTSLDLVTFVSEDFAEETGEYLNALGVDFDSLSYQPFDLFSARIRFDADVAAVYDSDQKRLDRYGQRGTSVVRGLDF